MEMMDVRKTGHLFCEEPHTEQAGVDDADALALQVRYEGLQGRVIETVVAVRQHSVHIPWLNPAGRRNLLSVYSHWQLRAKCK